MKRTYKLFINLLAIMMCIVCCFSFVGCREDIKTIELQISVYDYDDDKEYEDVTLTVELYRHLAPQTVDAIIKYVEEGYYDNAIFYKDASYSSQIMLGDLLIDGEDLAQNAIKPQLEGEFEKGAVTGSNLVNNKGYIGLWRTWCAQDNQNAKYAASNGFNSGRATWYIPTAENVEFNGYFCVFATIDLEDEANTDALSYISEAVDNNAEQYVIYYTGEYDATKVNENYGLTFNSMLKSEFDKLSSDEIEELEIFEAEGSEYVEYNQKTISVATFTDGKTGAFIKKAIVK